MRRKSYMQSVPVLPRKDETPEAIEARRKTEMAFAISRFLAGTYMLYQKALIYHWNVTGEHFMNLHPQFKAEYEALHDASISIAERIRALGQGTPKNPSEFATLSGIPEDRKLPATAQGMIANLQKCHEMLSREARDLQAAATQAGDAVTADLMIRRMAFHDKAAWMLRSLLAGNHYG
jgi:starvation-inducible DNA-binding protein